MIANSNRWLYGKIRSLLTNCRRSVKRRALAAGLSPPNHKRVYRVMKAHGLLLDAGGAERRHDGRIAGG